MYESQGHLEFSFAMPLQLFTLQLTYGMNPLEPTFLLAFFFEQIGDVFGSGDELFRWHGWKDMCNGKLHRNCHTKTIPKHQRCI